MGNCCSLIRVRTGEKPRAPFVPNLEHPELDVAVIGAGRSDRSLRTLNARQGMLKTVIDLGLAGIAFARFYLDIHPECRLTIFEKDEHIGGVWSAGM